MQNKKLITILIIAITLLCVVIIINKIAYQTLLEQQKPKQPTISTYTDEQSQITYTIKEYVGKLTRVQYQDPNNYNNPNVLKYGQLFTLDNYDYSELKELERDYGFSRYVNQNVKITVTYTSQYKDGNYNVWLSDVTIIPLS
ncbi:MAG: hypothetical protein FWF27_04160 [Candidatus Bathyarchaeota archaeon]|nr:hypothetical protein [Candidatus Termiticorpusculum sp.]